MPKFSEQKGLFQSEISFQENRSSFQKDGSAQQEMTFQVGYPKARYSKANPDSHNHWLHEKFHFLPFLSFWISKMRFLKKKTQQKFQEKAENEKSKVRSGKKKVLLETSVVWNGWAMDSSTEILPFFGDGSKQCVPDANEKTQNGMKKLSIEKWKDERSKTMNRSKNSDLYERLAEETGWMKE